MFVVLFTAAVVITIFVLAYNALVRLRVLVDNAWADIDVQLKRRYDLVPNLVETVKGYATHEKGTLDAVVAARNQAIAAKGPSAKGEAERTLASALGGLFALAEAYPQLRAAENFGQLQTALAQIEEALQSARRYYNAAVRDLNTRIAQIPWNLIASWFSFQPREFFQLEDETQRAAPAVRFNG